MINKMGKVFIIMLMVLNTMENGWMRSSMDREKRFGQMDQYILEITWRVKNKEREYFHGSKDQNMMEIFIRIEFME